VDLKGARILELADLWFESLPPADPELDAGETANNEKGALNEQAGQQSARDRVTETEIALAQLLELWKSTRRSLQPLADQESALLSQIFYESMPPDRATIQSMERLYQPELLLKFCKEESASLQREQTLQKKHKEFMMLHGTRWDTVKLVCAESLDPDCGHLGRGSWLGQNAGACHIYAAKGPGPEQEDGTRLFAIFVVACLPNSNEGDGERSFGVWRIMSSRRMYPAYLIIYSAPMDVRVKQPFPSPRMNRSAMLLRHSNELAPSCSETPVPKVPKSPQFSYRSSPPSSARQSLERGTATSPEIRTRLSDRGTASSPELRVRFGNKSNMHRTASRKVLSEESDGARSWPGWQVHLENGWAPFSPGIPFDDRPGARRDFVLGKYWYRLVFHPDGLTGTQTNLSTGKVRKLRRARNSSQAPASSSSVCTPENHVNGDGNDIALSIADTTDAGSPQPSSSIDTPRAEPTFVCDAGLLMAESSEMDGAMHLPTVTLSDCVEDGGATHMLPSCASLFGTNPHLKLDFSPCSPGLSDSTMDAFDEQLDPRLRSTPSSPSADVPVPLLSHIPPEVCLNLERDGCFSVVRIPSKSAVGSSGVGRARRGHVEKAGCKRQEREVAVHATGELLDSQDPTVCSYPGSVSESLSDAFPLLCQEHAGEGGRSMDCQQDQGDFARKRPDLSLKRPPRNWMYQIFPCFCSCGK
jgi:hypothetical protein